MILYLKCCYYFLAFILTLCMLQLWIIIWIITACRETCVVHYFLLVMLFGKSICLTIESEFVCVVLIKLCTRGQYNNSVHCSWTKRSTRHVQKSLDCIRSATVMNRPWKRHSCVACVHSTLKPCPCSSMATLKVTWTRQSNVFTPQFHHNSFSYSEALSYETSHWNLLKVIVQ